MSIEKLAHLVIVLVAIVVALIFGKSLLIPFVFSLLLWFLIREIRHRVDKVKVIRERFPSWSKNLVASLFMMVILAFVSKILLSSINKLAKSYKIYEDNIGQLVKVLNEKFNINLSQFLKSHAADFDLGAILGALFNSLSDIFGNAFVIIFYTLFIFLEEVHFEDKLKKVFPNKVNFERISATLDKVEHSIARYIGLKTVISIVTGLLSFGVFYFIGLDAPFFWAFLIFILNFIPTVGSLVGTIFPTLFCLLQFGDYLEGIQVLVLVGLIQVLIGNVVEPRLMGNSLNISSLVAIVALSFWGVIWGVTGMILSVPVTVILVILFAQFEQTKSVAIMLSDKGDV